MQNALNKSRCISFGLFDGVHLGHQEIISKVVKIASSENIEPAILCLECTEEIKKQKKALSTKKEKNMLIKKHGIKEIITHRMEKSINEENLESFIKNILCKNLNVKIIVVGKDYKYLPSLKKYSKKYDYKLIECNPVSFENEIISSEKIIENLSKGFLSKANKMLGHPYFFIGKIMSGKGLGRTVGMPTANIDYKFWKQLPKDGVYATRSKIDGKNVKGLTNIGRRPSVDNDRSITIETFFVDFSKNLYDKEINLEIISYVRNVKKFKNIEAVKKQVDEDVKKITNMKII